MTALILAKNSSKDIVAHDIALIGGGFSSTYAAIGLWPECRACGETG